MWKKVYGFCVIRIYAFRLFIHSELACMIVFFKVLDQKWNFKIVQKQNVSSSFSIIGLLIGKIAE